MLRRARSTSILLGVVGFGCAAQPDTDDQASKRLAAESAVQAMRADGRVQELLAGLSASGCVPNVESDDVLPLIDHPESPEAITIFSKRECEDRLLATGIFARVGDGVVEYASAFILPQRALSDGSDLYPDYQNFVGFISQGGELKQYDSYRSWREEMHSPTTARLATDENLGAARSAPSLGRKGERVADEGSDFQPLAEETCTECVARAVAADASDRASAARLCEQANAELRVQAEEQEQADEWADFLLGAATGQTPPVATSNSSAGAVSFVDCNEEAGEALTAARAQSEACSGSCVEEAQCDPAGASGCSSYTRVANDLLYCEPAVECVRVREDADPRRYYVCATEADGQFVADGAGYVGNPDAEGTCE